MGLFGKGGLVGGLVKVVVAAAAVAAIVYTGGAALGLTSAAFSMAGLGAAAGMAALYSGIAFTATALLSERPSMGGYSLDGGLANFGNELRGQLVSGKSPNASARVVYGKTRLAGNIVFIETTGDKNQTLFQVATIAGHEIQSVDQVYLNDDLYGGTYKGKGDVFYYDVLTGTATQSPSSLLTGTTAASYQYKGVACIITKYVYNQDVYTQGLPNITVIVRGKKIFDPRLNATQYTNNAALVIMDYLMDSVYGMAATAAEIDQNSFITAANICDQTVYLAGGTESESRYTINGAFSSDNQPKDVLKKMLTACGGVLTYTGGKWTLKVAAWREPTTTITEDEIVGEINMQASQSKRDIFNAVKGIYSSALDLYQPVSFPPVRNSTYEAEDGEVIWNDVQFPFTTSYATCQRLAKIELEKARQQIILNISVNLKCFGLQPADNVYVDFDRYGWNQKPFEVLTWEFSTRESNGVPVPVINLTLKETAEEVYDWNDGEETTVDPSPNTNLPNSFIVNAPTSLQATSQSIVLQDGTIQSGIVLQWNAPLSSFVNQYEVQWIRGNSSSDWGLVTESADTTVNYGAVNSTPTLTDDYGSIADNVPSQEANYNAAYTTVTNYTIVPVVEGVEYTVRVRAYNALGVRSAWTTLNSTPVGDTSPPALVDNFSILAGYKQLTLTWTNPSDADFDFVEIFYNTTNNLTTATRAGVIRASIFVHSGLGVNQTLYYWTRTVDKSGNRSAFSDVTSGTTAFIDSDIFSAEVMNLFSEAGAYGIEPVASLPMTGDFDGQIKYDTTANKLYRWDASTNSWTDDIFSITAGSVDLASFASGIEPIGVVTSLPSASGYTGAKVVFLTTDGKLYRYTGGSWTTSVLAGDVSGTLATDNFDTSLRPVEIVSALPSTGNFVGRMAFLTTDNKLYRYVSTGWTSATAAADISGLLTNAQIDSLAASKVTGTLTSSQIADVDAAKITGQITGTQITDGAVSAPKIRAGAVTTAKLAAGAVTADTISANAITAAKLDTGAVTTAKLAAGAVTADNIAANAVTTAKLAAGAVTADNLAANSITTGKIAAGAITSSLLASDSVIAGKVAAGAINTAALQSNIITADKIQAGAITTDKIAANSITAGLIAASGVITSAAQINDALITNAKIANLAVTTGKIVDGSITNAKIADAAITNAKIANASITTAKIASQIQSNNYVADSTGWAINSVTGNAQFNNVRVRGDVEATTINAGVANIVNTLNIQGQAVTIPVSSYTGSNVAYTSVYLDGNYPILIVATFTQATWTQLAVGDQSGQIWTGQPEPATLATQCLVVNRPAGTWNFYAAGGNGPTTLALIVCKR